MRFAIPLAVSAAVALVGACQTVPPPASPVATTAPAFEPKSAEARGLKLALNRCADCHSVGYGETSPVPHAPSFSAIASARGLTAASLTQWLRDHRNYPAEMYFEIPAEHIADLTAYMVTLRRQES
jgi:mono/diheme cytochrome c family protein